MEYVNFNIGTITHSIDKKVFLQRITVRKAVPGDVRDIYKIAASVGKETKISEHGFLIDDYNSNPMRYMKMFLSMVRELDYFYVACFHNRPVAFLMAYKKDQWLKYNPTWIETVYWKPDFDKSKIDNFVLIDKTAVYSGMTGMGIGSKLYKRLIKDMAADGITDIFAETVIDPVPNFASLQFRRKQKYSLAGVRYEEYQGKMITDLIYYKPAQQ